jgi:hypothetical protein
MTTASQANEIDVACHGRACRGEHYSGDLAFIREQDPDTFLAVVDAAGHGRSAYMVVLEVENILRAADVRDLMTLVPRLHDQLKGGPGAVVIAGYLNRESLEFTYVRIGDSHGRISAPVAEACKVRPECWEMLFPRLKFTVTRLVVETFWCCVPTASTNDLIWQKFQAARRFQRMYWPTGLSNNSGRTMTTQPVLS